MTSPQTDQERTDVLAHLNVTWNPKILNPMYGGTVLPMDDYWSDRRIIRVRFASLAKCIRFAEDALTERPSSRTYLADPSGDFAGVASLTAIVCLVIHADDLKTSHEYRCLSRPDVFPDPYAHCYCDHAEVNDLGDKTGRKQFIKFLTVTTQDRIA
jgi:hypothetical protein